MTQWDDRTNLDRATPRRRNLRCPGERLVPVSTVQQIEAGQRLFGLAVRAVGVDDVAALVAGPNGRRGGRRLPHRTAAEYRGGSGAELAVFDHLRGLVGVRPVDVGGVGEGEVLRHDDS